MSQWLRIRELASELQAAFQPWLPGGNDQERLYDPEAFATLCKIVDGVRRNSSRVLWSQLVDIKQTTKYLVGPNIELPITPFPGLYIADLIVKEVHIYYHVVMIHDLIQYEDIDKEVADVLIRIGWTLRDSEEDD